MQIFNAVERFMLEKLIFARRPYRHWVNMFSHKEPSGIGIDIPKYNINSNIGHSINIAYEKEVFEMGKTS